MTEIDTYQKGNFKLEEWEDVNYCEHDFYKNDEGLTDKDVVDLLNEQEETIQELKKELKNRKKLNTILEGFLLDKGYDFNDIIKFLQDRTEKREGE